MRPLAAALLLTTWMTAAAACGTKGEPSGISAAETFQERSDAEVLQALAAAKEQARREGKHVLLEFVAPWCADCREVAKIARREPAASVLRDRYVVVPVNVGQFNRHKALLQEHDVKVIAALVVLDADGKRVAKTTLEPISRKEALTPEELATWLRSPTGS
jgi:thiol:disulfide interchange protein